MQMWVCICLLLALLRRCCRHVLLYLEPLYLALYLADSLLSLLPQLYVTITVTIIVLQSCLCHACIPMWREYLLLLFEVLLATLSACCCNILKSSSFRKPVELSWWYSHLASTACWPTSVYVYLWLSSLWLRQRGYRRSVVLLLFWHAPFEQLS